MNPSYNGKSLHTTINTDQATEMEQTGHAQGSPRLVSDALASAAQSLQPSDLPLTLRVTRYLRISCLHLNSTSLRYSSLMKALFTQNPAWLDTLSISPNGYLQSSDPAIQVLLNPITALHQPEQSIELTAAA